MFFEKQLNYNSKSHPSKFFKRITKYESNADISYDGLNPPTYNDYLNWTKWYSSNHDSLRFDRKNKEVYTIGRNNWFLDGFEECIDFTYSVVNNQNNSISLGLEREENSKLYDIRFNLNQVKSIIKLLGENNTLNDLYAIQNNEEHYVSIITKIRRLKNEVKLLIKVNYLEPCETDTLYILVFDKNIANNILKESSLIFTNNISFERLREQL